MEFYRILRGEFLKQRKSFTWSIAFFTPVLAGALSFINLLIRYDYLIGLEANEGLSSWNILLFQHHFIWAIFLPLVVTLLASMVHYIEYKSNGWKSALALPVSKWNVYLAKWSTVFILSSIMILINGLVLSLVGLALRFPESVDLILILKYTFYQLIGILGLISLQSLISAGLKNTNIALAIGFVGVASSLFFAQSETMSKFIPYTYTLYTLPDPTINNNIPLQNGFIIGIVLLLIGMIFFNRKEIC